MFERFFHYSNELLCIASLEGRFLYINDAFVKLLGYSKEELLSRKFLDFIHPDDIDKTLDEVKGLSQGVTTVNFENRYLDVNGVTKVLSWKSTIDEYTGWIFAVARDITAEKNAVSNYFQLYSAITNNVIFAKTNNKGVITEVNEKFCNISGYSEKELLGKTHKVVNSGVHDKSFFKDMWQTISSGKVWTGAITNRRKNGSLYFVESVIAPIVDINGRIESYMAIRSDITERVEYKEESLKTLSILNETSAIAKVGGWELDVETGVLSWTEETFKILGVEKKQGRSPILPEGLQLFVDEHKPIIDEAVKRAMEHGEPYSLELQAQTPKGEVKWIYTDGRANYVDGKIKTLSGTIQDIHEKKLAEIKYNQERQKSIMSSKFAALGELSASIAHEINNPLGIISGYTELLKYQGNLGEDEKLDAILKSCERISYIVKSLKRFSRSDETPKKSAINLTEIVKEALSLTSPRAKRNLTRIAFEEQGNFMIWGHDIEIEQVVINLINNAIDAVSEREERSIALNVSAESEKVVFTIRDSGGGVPDEVLVKMFEPFYTTKDINKGTGLGLSVVKGILDSHNATIEVVNTDTGALFTLTFDRLAGSDI
jgi:PAS domain S-box-containing protein